MAVRRSVAHLASLLLLLLLAPAAGQGLTDAEVASDDACAADGGADGADCGLSLRQLRAQA
eukprot:CAMPEP_0198539654 /NCGR_PEP_ID=MMETSP1462-20131121/49875_1 /TAXON_ID=1333877 /ORGANISM="Brandtodinium nutriculum, Strain RCC3387" /LENGTH=60 /DNA_ID=CAMNT_0044269713 /DNA_START=84 /DNA_END=263 /DNA_ORIENTATION=+